MKRVFTLSILALSLCVFAFTARTLAEDKPADKSTDKPAEKKERKTYTEAPKMVIDKAKTYTATLDTDKGKIVIELFAKDAPQTVNSFVVLSRDGFYDGLIFHRVIPGFMIQGGDPTGTGRSGPGYQFENENKDTTKTFQPVTVGMANSGPDTNGSQFFIMDASNPLPPSQYTIFAQLKEGQDVVHAIAAADRDESDDRPKEDIHIKTIKIEEK